MVGEPTSQSNFTWLDYSERDRRRALDVVDLFRESGTVDELGIGSIRDSFSDLLFPGTSTIQTRACYFILLPWTFLRLERLGVSSREAPARAEQEEKLLNGRMLDAEDTDGVFGARAGAALKRLPSEAYWGGLESWGIRLFPGHRGAYFRSLDGFYRRAKHAKEMPRDPEAGPHAPANWHPHVPSPPPGFPYENVSTALRRGDAEYLRDRIQARHAGTLLGVLSGRAEPVDLAAKWPWDLDGLPEASPALREQLAHARLFSIALHGGALLYNLMLAELRVTRGGASQESDEKRIAGYREELDAWATDVEALGPALHEWDLAGVWAITRKQGRSLGYPTRAFVHRWVERLTEDGPRSVVDATSPARDLIREREIQIKRGRARLASPRHLELWGGRSGADRMDFRWNAAKVLLRDIFDGLARSEGDAGDA